MAEAESPPKLNRSLIDASERPLRRSPPGRPYEQEEWPVLFPERPTTPATLQAMAGQQDGIIASLVKPQARERYPLLPSGSYGQSPDMERLPVQKFALSPKIQRKQVSSSSLRQDPAAQRKSQTSKENIYPGKDASRLSTGSTTKSISGSPSKPRGLSAGAAAIEKSSIESKSTIEPRQTRTSSLRARLSAGQVIKESPSGSSKGLGSTEFTSLREPLKDHHKERHQSPSRLSGAHAISKKNSKDSLHGRKPAQFIAGSRRPPSRGSLRNESRASSHSSQLPPPNRTAPAIPAVVDSADPFHSKPLMEHKQADVVRKSSLPVFRQTVSTIVTQADDQASALEEEGLGTHTGETKIAPHDFGIYEDQDDGHQVPALGAIEESPQPKYQTKRLSMNSPEHGPTLKISPSADRLIMGTESDKENEPDSKTKKKRYGFMNSESRSSSKIRAPTRSSNKPVENPRPSSSQGLPLSASRPKLVDAETREKKVKSADVGACLGIDHLLHLSGKETPSSSRKNIDASGSDDPFFDAKSSLSKRMSRVTGTEKEPLLQDDLLAPEIQSWVEPVKNHLSQTEDGDASLLPADVHSVFTHDEADVPRHQVSLPTASQSKVKSSKAPPILEHTLAKVNEPSPSTPNQANTIAGTDKSGSLPPRSSSRTAHPNFTAKKLSPISPLGNKEHVPQGFTDRQNRLGSLRGHGTSQVDLGIPSNRTSIAQESNKSHGSVSKGVLSKFGGLFHKRNSDDPNIPLKSGKKSKQKLSITTNGSPFPPISEVHPIHRPTLSSMRRANGNAPRSPLPDSAINGASSPTFNSPLPTEVSTTTTVAMQILESARKERSSPKKERLLELGKIMVDAITQARDAEKAMEEAKQAARKAEVAHALCRKSVGDISALVVAWRDEIARGA